MASAVVVLGPKVASVRAVEASGKHAPADAGRCRTQHVVISRPNQRSANPPVQGGQGAGVRAHLISGHAFEQHQSGVELAETHVRNAGHQVGRGINDPQRPGDRPSSQSGHRSNAG